MPDGAEAPLTRRQRAERDRALRLAAKQESGSVTEPGAPTANPETDTPATARTGGRTLHWAVMVISAEAGLLAALTVLTIWAAATHSTVGLSSAAATPAFAALCAAIFGGLAYALHRGKSLARGPAIVLEMLMLPIGYYMAEAGLAQLGIPTMVLGLAGTVLLLAPSTRQSLGMR